MTPTLELRGVTRVHGTGRLQVDALVGANLAVEPGSLVAVMGPSGSGKTTLLSLAGGLERPTSGEVYVDGTSLAQLTVGQLASLRRRRIGYVFQQFNLIEGLTALENVSIPLELDGVARREASVAAMEALDRLGLSELARRFPDELSGGEQQRVAIGRAVVGDRVLLLADEPTGALDTVTGYIGAYTDGFRTPLCSVRRLESRAGHQPEGNGRDLRIRAGNSLLRGVSRLLVLPGRAERCKPKTSVTR